MTSRLRFRLRRFERRILVAMLIVALGPLVGALLLGRQALREAYGVGMNARVRTQLDQGLALYRAHLVALRDSAERTADAVAADPGLRAATDAGELDVALEALLARYPEIVSLEVDAHPGAPGAQVERAAPLAEPMRPITLERDAGATSVRVTVAAPERLFSQYREAGAMRDVYARLEADRDYVSATYLLVYSALLGTVILVGLVVGLVLSRRVTRRVALLAEATTRVGAGDLGVSLPLVHDDEIGELTRAFNRMVRDLARSRDRIDYLQRVSAWQDFARRLAHEIKNPLTPIQLAMQEVHRSYQGEDGAYARKLDDALVIVEEEIATLRRLVGEFSSFARLPQAHLEPADLGEVLREQARALEAIPDEAEAHEGAPRHEVRVDVRPPEEGVSVSVDPMLLRRVLDNLVRNAVQAIRGVRRSGHVVVEGRLDAEDDVALVEVRDDGPGVARAVRDRLFDPYVTTRVDGTGLGLAIVKKIVLEHGGSIEVHDAPEGGACFRLSLPIRSPGRGA